MRKVKKVNFSANFLANFLLVGVVPLTLGLSGCHHSYDPKKNPLLTEPISVTVPDLINLENMVRQKDLKEINLPNDDRDTSLINACLISSSHFETPEALGSKNCDFIFEKIVKEAEHQKGVLSSLTLDDLMDPKVQEKLHQALFSMAAYGHLPREIQT